MSGDARCPRCGSTLEEAGEQCPRCLLKAGLADEAGDRAPAEEMAGVSGPTRSVSSAEPGTSPAEADRHPDHVGPYKLLEVLGEGGMGIVYLAEQTQPIRRRVALKVIKPGMDTRQVLARFEVERQALAVMNHPNVAKVFDAGVTEQGRPYFVMEYVAGIPITQYCDMRCLSLTERLELFIQVCQAIQHAHQKGIIHRDIKPSNVLVSSGDDKPVPKVIDFGLAKATGQRLTERSLFTHQGLLMGTPAYMSPEQAEQTALDVDARTDIYSLGVLLYELLVGALPFDPATLRQAAVVEVIRIIREEDPPKPTTKFTSLGDGASEIARRRQTDVRALAHALRGELEWITMRALERDPARRYPSASELAADVQRHLVDEPVVAGPPGWSYRLKKLARRHKAPVAALGVSLATLLVGVVVSTTLYVRSEAARRRAEVEAKRNTLEARAVQAAMANDADQYQKLSREALELHRSVLGESNPKLALYLVNRLSILRLGEFAASDEGPDLERKALELVGRGLETGDPDSLKAAVLLTDLLESGEAESLARKALGLMGKTAGADEEVAYQLEKLAAHAHLRRAEDGESLEEVYRATVARRRKVLPRGAPGLVESRLELAAFLQRKGSRLVRSGNAAAAEPVLREALSLHAEAPRPLPAHLPEVHGFFRTAVLHSDLGACLISQRRFAEAERALLDAHDLLLKEPEQSALIQVVLHRLADLYTSWGRPEKASRYLALLPAISVAEVWDLGPMPFDETVVNRAGGGYSARLDGLSLWVFSETQTRRPGADGKRFRHATLGWTDDLDAGNGLRNLHERKDASGVPVELFPLTDEEADFNAAHTGRNCTERCGAEWFLEPGAVVADPERARALVFYTRVLREPRSEDQRAGASLAVLSRGGEACARPNVRPGEEHPTLLFGPGEPAWGSAALVVDGELYAYGCECRGLGCPCQLGRVPLAAALDRSAWRFYAGSGRWSDDWRDARAVLDGGNRGRLSVDWNPYLGKFVATSSRILSSLVSIRVADRPEGEWSALVAQVQTEPSERQFPGWDWTSWGLAHPELAREGGRTQYLTFARDAGNRKEMRLMEVRFRKK